MLLAVLALHLAPVSPDLPNKQPQLAASKNLVAMAFGSGQSIWVARSTDHGRTFSPPAKVGDLPKLMLGRHRGPRVAIAGSAMVVSAIGAEGDIVSWRSTDAGASWSKGPAINDAPRSAAEGLHAMTADAAGNLAAVWLDLRTPGTTRLFGAFSKDAGATWSKNVLVYQSPGKTICECCHPSLAAGGNEEFVAMWRNAVDGSRDLYALRIRDGKPAGDAVKQGEGTWKLEACPMDGGGVALRNGEIVSAWRREKDIYLARRGKPEVKLGPGQDVALAANAKGEYAVWTTGKALEALLPGSSTPTRLSDAGAFAALIALPDGAVLAAWEENGGIATKRLE